MTLYERNQALIATLARELNLEVRALRAVLEVEAAGEGLVNGRPIIRLEVHKLWLGVRTVEKRAQVDAHFVVRGPRAWEGHEVRLPDGWMSLHRAGLGGQLLEWRALGIAMAIDHSVAIESTSWGCGQILGIHWKALGFTSAAAFADAMQRESSQLRYTVRLFSVMGVVDDLRAHRWAEFARVYNGTGQVEWYASRIDDAYDRLAPSQP